TTWRAATRSATRPRSTSSSSCAESALAGPGPGVVRVGDATRRRGREQRPERVDHHGELLGPRLLHGRLDAAGLRSVHEARRVPGDRPGTDAGAGPAHEVTRGVEDDLVAVHVGMVVRTFVAS